MATTWASTGVHSVKATCTTGSESAPAAPVQASQTVAFASAVAGNTVTVRGMVFTAIASDATPATPQEFSVGASNTACGDNFVAAIAKNRGALKMTGANATGTVTLTADDYGAAANTWTLTKVGAPITLGGATFAGGVDPVGAPLSDVASVVVSVAAGAGQTVAGGTLLAYALNPRYLWDRIPDADLSVGATAARSYAFGALAISGRAGRIAYVPSGVTISSGSAIVYHDCYDASGSLV